MRSPSRIDGPNPQMTSSRPSNDSARKRNRHYAANFRFARLGAEIAKKGSTSYTTHFVFHPTSSIDIPGVGKATALEAVGPTENTKGDAMLHKMKAKCAAVSVESGAKKWIDGACALTDNDGDVVFSTFDTRDLDKS